MAPSWSQNLLKFPKSVGERNTDTILLIRGNRLQVYINICYVLDIFSNSHVHQQFFPEIKFDCADQ